MTKFLIPCLLCAALSAVVARVYGQEYNHIPYFAHQPSDWWVGVATGGAGGSFQDQKMSSQVFYSVDFPLQLGAGYRDERHEGAATAGFWLGAARSANGGYNLVNHSRWGLAAHYRTLVAKQPLWWGIAWRTGGAWELFYDFRTDFTLTQNRRLAAFGQVFSWSNSFYRSVDYRQKQWLLAGVATVGMVGKVGTSNSLAANLPESSLRSGIFNYQTFATALVEYAEWQPVGKFIHLNTSLSITRPIDFNNRRLYVGLQYDWQLFYLASSASRRPFVSGMHTAWLVAKYALLTVKDDE